MHDDIILKRKTTTISKRRRFYRWALHYFLVFFCLVMFYEPQTGALWSLKNYKLYTSCTLILSNPLHLTVGSKLIMNQNEL